MYNLTPGLIQLDFTEIEFFFLSFNIIPVLLKESYLSFQ